ncbi:MAG: hypothetical protein ISR95_06570 [Candidatus Marinimicrobia bacterium]|nr:hypothetical protein [Candidatus Neomarinimicrobiota bacterium]MBL7047275.1 hypothetical protein [Candidatus Neomarinimicrobiota bacterium]
MGRKKREMTRIRGIRLPERLWKLLDTGSTKEGRSVNAQIWKIVEDWLVDNKYLKEDERKR